MFTLPLTDYPPSKKLRSWPAGSTHGEAYFTNDPLQQIPKHNCAKYFFLNVRLLDATH